MRSILVIDDESMIHQRYRWCIKNYYPGQFVLYSATTLAHAEELWQRRKNDPPAAIFVDGTLTGEGLDTENLIKTICSDGYKGRLVANSSHGPYIKRMLRAGCNYASDDKYRLVELRNLLRTL